MSFRSIHYHVCGCYFNTPNDGYLKRNYLPRTQLHAHTTIYSTAYSTKLTQIYENPTDSTIDEIRYTFPLFDGVSVVGFECIIRDRVIKGVVKEREDAKKTYEVAKQRGQTAGLLEQLPDTADVFTTSIGNVPAHSKLAVNLVYVGELKHDAEVDGLRLNMPTSIAPRYGSVPGALLKPSTTGSGIEVSVDVNLDSTSRIQKIISPSHSIAVNIGTLSTDVGAEPKFQKGSATLALGHAELNDDFVLQIVASDTAMPRSLLESHPTIPGQRALMATLVPRFSLKPNKPEVIFVADRSGSMQGNVATLKAALHVFLKSLPIGVKFNICSFGTRHELLWPKSKTYDRTSLGEAQAYVNSFGANFGGTETLRAVTACVESRLDSLDTEIMLLTDGDIWQQGRMFDYVNEQVEIAKGRLRVFPIGIGGGVSSALIEGVARAGNGFSQQVANGERLDGKIVRMLKGALTPHINDYSLEVNYASKDAQEEDEDFELVEKVTDSLEADLSLSKKTSGSKENMTPFQPISLYDPKAEDKMDIDIMQDAKHQFDHLPELSPPKLLQVPHKIPTLFPFSRFSAYILMSPQSSQLKPVSVTLRATSAQGPLELRIPVEQKEGSDSTIHWLAAKKATQELEEGRGWLHDARDPKNDNKLVKDTYPAYFNDIVKREAVRLGVEFQVGGKWCSFVAVDETEGSINNAASSAPWSTSTDTLDALQTSSHARNSSRSAAPASFASSTQQSFGSSQARRKTSGGSGMSGFRARVSTRLGGLFSGPQNETAKAMGPPMQQMQMASQAAPAEGQGFGTSFAQSSAQPETLRLANIRELAAPNRSLFAQQRGGTRGGGSTDTVTNYFDPTCMQQSQSASSATLAADSDSDEDMGMGCFGDSSPAPTNYAECKRVSAKKKRSTVPTGQTLSSQIDQGQSEQDLIHRDILNNVTAIKDSPSGLTAALIDAQSFEGSWGVETVAKPAIGVDQTEVKKKTDQFKVDVQVLATVVVLLFLAKHLSGEKESWELVAEKGWSWVEEQIEETACTKGSMEKAALKLMGSN